MLRSIVSLVALAAFSAVVNAQTTPSAAPSASPGAPAPGKIAYSSVNADGPYIALTFDDGPHTTNTPRLLDILAKRNIKVTFFVIGENVQANPAILKREVAEGHEIGNHTWDHPNLAKKSDDAVRSELRRTQDIIVQTIGTAPTLMRPPYGELTAKQRKWVNAEFGYKVILWAVDPLDWKRPGSSVVAQRILSETRAGNIILVHDIHAPTIDAIPEVLDGLLAKGFKFVTVSQLLAMDRPGKQATAPAPSPVAAATPAPVPAAPAAPASAPKKNDLPDSL
jgi:peptidoglycan/xylan/chitin deacetylase (PgdA/CDA1 family)